MTLMTQTAPEQSVTTEASMRRALSTSVDICIIGGGLVGNSMACSLLPPISSAHSIAASSMLPPSEMKGLRIALIDSAKQPLSSTDSEHDSRQYSNRVSALTPSSVRLLQDIGAWHHVNLRRVQPFEHMHVWDSSGEGKITFSSDLNPHNEKAMGVIAENNELNRALFHRLRDYHRHQGIGIDTAEQEADKSSEGGGLLMLHNAAVQEIRWPASESTESEDRQHHPVSLQINCGNTEINLEAGLVIGADGGQSFVRQSLQHDPVDFNGWDYNQNGVVGTVDINLATSLTPPTCWQRFLPTGPLALLPLSDSVYSLVWSCPPSMAKHLCSIPDEPFCHLLNTALHCDPVDLEYCLSMLATGSQSMIADEYGWRRSVNGAHSGLVSNSHMPVPPEVRNVHAKSRASFPLRFRHASRYIDNRLALIGDAAHQIHPMAGQGLNLGLGDVACLSRVLREAVLSGRDVGDLNVLRDYNRERMLKNGAMMTAIDSLWRLFDGSSSLPVPGTLTSWGMQMVNNSSLAKSMLMRAAMSSSFP